MNLQLLRTVLRQYVQLVIAELDRQKITPAPPEIAYTICEAGKMISRIDQYQAKKKKRPLPRLNDPGLV